MDDGGCNMSFVTSTPPPQPLPPLPPPPPPAAAAGPPPAAAVGPPPAAAAADVAVVDGLVATVRSLMESPEAAAQAEAWGGVPGGEGVGALALLHDSVVQLQTVRGVGGVCMACW